MYIFGGEIYGLLYVLSCHCDVEGKRVVGRDRGVQCFDPGMCRAARLSFRLKQAGNMTALATLLYESSRDDLSSSNFRFFWHNNLDGK
jgi:hypothetical protein